MLLQQKHGVCRTEIHECAHPRDLLENPQSCFEGSFLNPLTFLCHERWKNAARCTGNASVEERLWSDATDLQRGSSCRCICCSGKTRAPETADSHPDSNAVPPQPPTLALISVLRKA